MLLVAALALTVLPEVPPSDVQLSGPLVNRIEAIADPAVDGAVPRFELVNDSALNRLHADESTFPDSGVDYWVYWWTNDLNASDQCNARGCRWHKPEWSWNSKATS